MYYTVIKHDGHLRTRGKCRKHEPQAKNNKTRFFYVLYSDKTYIFNQSERTLGPIFILNDYNIILYWLHQLTANVKFVGSNTRGLAIGEMLKFRIYREE